MYMLKCTLMSTGIRSEYAKSRYGIFFSFTSLHAGDCQRVKVRVRAAEREGGKVRKGRG